MGELQIAIDKEIGSGFFSEGITAKSIAEKISKNKKADPIILNIDSPGGSVYEGYSIANLILEQKAQGKRVEAVIKGMCASIATLIASTADKVTMYPFSSWMIHNPFVGMEGDAEELRKAADQLETIQNKIVDVYTAKTGKSKEEIQALMNEERVLTAQEAVDWGFADEIVQIKAVAYWKHKEKDEKMESNKMVEALDKLTEKIGNIFNPKAEAETTTEDPKTKVKPEVDEEKEALKKELDELKIKLASVEAEKEEKAKQLQDNVKVIEEVKTEIQNLKKLTIGSGAPPNPVQNFKDKQDKANPFDAIANSLKK